MSEPPRLDYRSADDEGTGAALVVHAVVGCALTCGLVVGSVIGILVMMAARSTESDPVSWVMAVAVGGMVLGGLVWLALRAHRSPRNRGWAIGIWLGLGMGCLVMGLCFMGFVGVAG